MGADSIILGDGVFAVNDVDVALTRGGGQFLLEREYKLIDADGDFGPVKGRVRKIRSTAKLVMNALELLPANMTKFYPSMDLDTSDTAKDVLTAAVDIVDGDYTKVTWTGKTKSGKQVYIELENAVNLENLEWSLIDKDEIVPVITMTAAYDPATRTTEPWKVEFVKGTTYTVTFTIDDGTSAVVGANVNFNNQTVTTIAGGIAEFTGVPIANNQPFSVVAGGFQTYYGAVNVVSADVALTVSLTSI